MSLVLLPRFLRYKLSGMKLIRVAVFILSFSIVILSAAAQSDLEKQAAAASERLIQLHRNWTKISAPGASIEAKEVFRSGASGPDLVVKYHFYVKGLPQDKLYESMNWAINQTGPQTTMEGISIGKDGLLMCAGRAPEQCGDPFKKDDPIEFTFLPAKGEPYRFGLAASDAPDVRITTVIVPDPIRAKDKGCSLEAIQLLPGFALAYVEGNGFQPNSQVSFDSQSFNEKHTAKAKTDDNGILAFAMLPFVAGHKNGTTHLGAVGNCSPSLSFDWGK